MQVKLKYTVEDPYAKNLIKVRGIEDTLSFLHPTKKMLQDPQDFDNIQKGITMLRKNRGTQTLLVVDSDADGYCSAAIIYQFLKGLYPSWEIDVVLHENKGHGLSDIVERLEIGEYSLVILPDSGSSDDKYFNEFPHVNFLVLDHHLRSEEAPIPENVALINNQLSENYLNKSLSGGGVTWQFCRAYANDVCADEDIMNKYLDLAAVSIIGDVMDITTLENRYIIKKGLWDIQSTFINELIENASFQLGGAGITPIGIAFYVVPNINAMCRMGTYEEKERMWEAFVNPETLTESHKRGVQKGTQVPVFLEALRECTNVKARQKRMQEKMADLCNISIQEEDLLSNKIITIELDEKYDDMPPELNGLTATKISNGTGHPTLIGRVNKDGFMRGSIRGLSTIDMPPLKEFLLSSGLFEYVQGHELAAGFSIPVKNLSAFHQWANEKLANVDLNSKTWGVDFDLNARDEELREIINDMDSLSHLWGQGFPEALISVRDIRSHRADIKVMGKNADTVKISCNGVSYMFFKQSMEQVKKLTSYTTARLNIVGTANLNEYRGNITPQVFVKDYEIFDDTLSF